MHSGLRHGSEPRLGRTRDVGPRRHELPFPRLSSARRRQDSGFPGEGTDGPAGQRAAGSWASVRGLGPVTWHDFEHLASGHLWQEHSALRVTFSNKRTASPASHRRSGSPRWASWPLPGQPGFIARGPGVPGLLPAGRGLGQVPSACAQTQCCPAAVDASHARAPRFQGYEGLVEGGENIKPANWLSVSNIIQLVRPRWSLPAREHACARTSRRDAGARTDAGTDRHWARLQAAMGSWSRDGPRQGHRQSSRSGEGGADTGKTWHSVRRPPHSCSRLPLHCRSQPPADQGRGLPPAYRARPPWWARIPGSGGLQTMSLWGDPFPPIELGWWCGHPEPVRPRLPADTQLIQVASCRHEP